MDCREARQPFLAQYVNVNQTFDCFSALVILHCADQYRVVAETKMAKQWAPTKQKKVLLSSALQALLHHKGSCCQVQASSVKDTLLEQVRPTLIVSFPASARECTHATVPCPDRHVCRIYCTSSVILALFQGRATQSGANQSCAWMFHTNIDIPN